jgi:hypothetical protein
VVEMVITTATERQGLVPMRLMLLVYCLQDEDVGYHHYQETSGDFLHALVKGGAQLLRRRNSIFLVF